MGLLSGTKSNKLGTYVEPKTQTIPSVGSYHKAQACIEIPGHLKHSFS